MSGLASGDRRPWLRRALRGAVAAAGRIACAVLVLLQPVLRLRIGKLPWERIGELTLRVDPYLRHRARGKGASERHVFVIGNGAPSNASLVAILRRSMRVVDGRLWSTIYDVVRERIPRSTLWIEMPNDQNEFELSHEAGPQVRFTEDEETQGRRLLDAIGVAGRPFVCFHARDKRYLDVVHAWRRREAWAYHDYRDSDIKRYVRAAEYLAARGIVALRMGYMVEEALRTTCADVIDYAAHHRSDFGDVYLVARAKFFLGTNAGLFGVAQMFGVPVAAANWIPLRFMLVSGHDLLIPKKLWDVESKRFLTFREIFQHGLDRFLETGEYRAAGIEAVENTADEILALAREMNDRIDGTWREDPADPELQERYRKLLPRGHHSEGFRCRLGAEFLRENRDLLD